MAEDRRFFENTVIAEMRGRVNDDGHSPFWDAVGKKYMDIEFVQADYLIMKSKSFIEELLPKYPILVDLLPKEAQEVVAQVHPNTVPARKILEQEGFEFCGLVGIFEPGPVLETKLDDVRALKESKVLQISKITHDEIDSEVFIISTSGEDKDFKACLGKLSINEDGTATICAVTATALKLRLGEKLRYVSLKKSITTQTELV